MSACRRLTHGRAHAVANFCCNMAEAEMVPAKNSQAENVFNILDMVFTGLFAIELIWNMAGTISRKSARSIAAYKVAEY